MLANSRRFLASLLFAYAFSFYGALGGLPGEPEHEIHLFLASHYAEDYFSLNDPRGENGFSVVGHPPLCHQMVALLSRLPGLNLERAYAVLTVAVALLLVLGSFALVGVLIDWGLTATSTLALTLYPYLYLFLFPYGQLPFMLSIGLAFGASAAIGLSARTDNRLAPFLAGALTVGSITAHPLGALPIALSLALCVFIKSTSERRTSVRRNLWWLLLSLAASSQVAYLALVPFFESVWNHQGRTISLSKLHLGQNPAVDASALVIALASLLIMLLAKHRRERALALVSLFILFASVWAQATGIATDKLLWLSGAFALIASGSLINWLVIRSGPAIPLAGIVSLALANAYILSQPPTQVTRKHRTTLTELVAALRQPGYEQWHYVTLGLGAERFALARKLRIGSLDSAMPWLLPTEELRGTPYYSIDELPLGDRSAKEVLHKLLRSADKHSLRWIITVDDRASALLEPYGYTVHNAWKEGVVLWSKDSVPPAVPAIRQRTPASFLWGIIPPLSLLISLVLCLAMIREAVPHGPRPVFRALEPSQNT